VTEEDVKRLVLTTNADEIKRYVKDRCCKERPLNTTTRRHHPVVSIPSRYTPPFVHTNRSLANIMGVTAAVTEGGSLESALIDLHFHNFAFCKECRFSPAQTSAFMSIFKTVIDEDRYYCAHEVFAGITILSVPFVPYGQESGEIG